MYELKEHWFAILLFLLVSLGGVFFVANAHEQNSLPGNQQTCDNDAENVLWTKMLTGKCPQNSSNL